MRYMIERMGLSTDEAEVRRARYYQQYGTSLRGLMAEDTVDAEDYLAFVHDIDLTRFIGTNSECIPHNSRHVDTLAGPRYTRKNSETAFQEIAEWNSLPSCKIFIDSIMNWNASSASTE